MDNELLRFARLVAAAARRAAPAPSRFATPAYAPAALLAMLPLRERLRLTYRGLEDLLRLSGQLRRVFGLRAVPDHATLWWFARRHVGPGLLDAALGETVRRARGGAPGARPGSHPASLKAETVRNRPFRAASGGVSPVWHAAHTVALARPGRGTGLGAGYWMLYGAAFLRC